MNSTQSSTPTNNNINNCLTTDVIIIGGGIAGLMLQNRLHSLGYSTLLLEQDSLGSGQTAKSQGIIHGGIKYALLGQITDAAKAVSQMPDLWQKYFDNTSDADIDLSNTKILSNSHMLWNNGDLKNRLKQVLMQKSLSSTGTAIPKYQYPELFKHPKFKGNVYKINETVVDVFSLLENLAKPHADKIIKIDQHSLKFFLNTKQEINNLTFTQDNKLYNIAAGQYICTAGQANQMLLDLLPKLPQMQLRPLHMVLAKFPQPNVLYGHYVGSGVMPQLTISTHYSNDGQYIWYIGGKLAETGIYLNSQQQILQAKVEIQNTFPWLDTSNWQWATTKVSRAEPMQQHNVKPDAALIAHQKNGIVAWPTKLTMTPIMVDEIINHFIQTGFKANTKQVNINDYQLKTAKVVAPFYDTVFKEEPVEA